MALNNAGRTLCVYTGRKPEIINDSCIYYSDTINRNFINSKDWSYLNTNGLAITNEVMFTYETSPDLFSGETTDAEIKTYIESKLKSINTISIKYYNASNDQLLVESSFSINKSQINQIINNPSKVVEFDRYVNMLEYSIKVNDDYTLGFTVTSGMLDGASSRKTLQFFINSRINLAPARYVAISEMCRDITDDEDVYLTLDYENIVAFGDAPQEPTWKNVQLSLGDIRTVSSRRIYGFTQVIEDSDATQ